MDPGLPGDSMGPACHLQYGLSARPLTIRRSPGLTITGSPEATSCARMPSNCSPYSSIAISAPPFTGPAGIPLTSRIHVAPFSGSLRTYNSLPPISGAPRGSSTLFR